MTSSGSCILSASTNNDAAAQIELRTTQHGATVDALDWIDGHRVWKMRETVVPIHFQNYLQTNGVRASENVLSVKAETLRGHCIRQVAILPGTGVATTCTRPDELLILLVPRQTIRATVGAKVQLPFKLRRRGGRPDGPLTVAMGSSPDYSISGPPRLTYSRVGSGISGSFTVIPRVANAGASISVLRRLNQPSASFVIQAGLTRASWYSSPDSSVRGRVHAHRRSHPSCGKRAQPSTFEADRRDRQTAR